LGLVGIGWDLLANFTALCLYLIQSLIGLFQANKTTYFLVTFFKNIGRFFRVLNDSKFEHKKPFRRIVENNAWRGHILRNLSAGFDHGLRADLSQMGRRRPARPRRPVRTAFAQ
jgi:hypothetical protein